MGVAPRIPDLIFEGQRNATLASLAGSMRRRGASAPVILAALREANRLQCRPPLDGDEVRTIAASIGRKPPGEEAGLGRAGPRAARYPALTMTVLAPQRNLWRERSTRSTISVANHSRPTTLPTEEAPRFGLTMGEERIWLIWHGHRWRPDRDQEIRRLWLKALGDRYSSSAPDYG